MKYGFALILALFAVDAHAFGGKVKVTEFKGVTESQVAWSPDARKATVMVRGKAAEMVFLMMQEKRTEHLGSDALALAKNMTNHHWTVSGKQVNCSKIVNEKGTKADFACAFEMDETGDVRAGVEPFNPSIFNLARTSVPVKFFKKGDTTRGLASATDATYGKSQAYVVYDKGEKAKEGKHALIVFKDNVARKFIEILGTSKETKEFHKNGAKGWKGREIACVEAFQGNPERCALVVHMEDGSISTSKNPLF